MTLVISLDFVILMSNFKMPDHFVCFGRRTRYLAGRVQGKGAVENGPVNGTRKVRARNSKKNIRGREQ